LKVGIIENILNFLTKTIHNGFFKIFKFWIFSLNIFKKFYSSGGLGKKSYRYKKIYFEVTPIPNPDKVYKDKIISLVSKIIEIFNEEKNPNDINLTKINKIENEIEKIVGKIYNLSKHEYNEILLK